MSRFRRLGASRTERFAEGTRKMRAAVKASHPLQKEKPREERRLRLPRRAHGQRREMGPRDRERQRHLEAERVLRGRAHAREQIESAPDLAPLRNRARHSRELGERRFPRRREKAESLALRFRFGTRRRGGRMKKKNLTADFADGADGKTSSRSSILRKRICVNLRLNPA